MGLGKGRGREDEIFAGGSEIYRQGADSVEGRNVEKKDGCLIKGGWQVCIQVFDLVEKDGRRDGCRTTEETGNRRNNYIKSEEGQHVQDSKVSSAGQA